MFPCQGCVGELCRIFVYDNVCECIRASCYHLEKQITLDDDADADRFFEPIQTSHGFDFARCSKRIPCGSLMNQYILVLVLVSTFE